MLTRNKDAAIDATFLQRRLGRALRLRERLFDRPFYRLVHAEADGLPGLVVDRFGDVLVCQLNSAGMARLEAPLLEALEGCCGRARWCCATTARCASSRVSTLEVRLARGELDGPVELVENGLTFLADPLGRPEDRLVLRPARQPRVRGTARAAAAGCSTSTATAAGFALAAAAAGAARCWRSTGRRPALDLALASAERNGLAGVLAVERAGRLRRARRGWPRTSSASTW